LTTGPVVVGPALVGAAPPVDGGAGSVVVPGGSRSASASITRQVSMSTTPSTTEPFSRWRSTTS
jgi:hypothetical protein